MTKKYIVSPIITTEEVKKLEGTFIPASYYKQIIDHDADVYWNDNGVIRLLFHYRKNAVPDKHVQAALKAFKKAAKIASSLRGKAGGQVEASKVSSNVDHVVSEGKFKTKVAYKDGTISNYYVSNKVNSLIAGYFDQPKLSDKHDVITKNLIPCRTTIFTERNTEKWKSVMPLMKLVDKFYAKHEPETHAKQYDLANKTPNFQIGDTAFSTLTVNLNWRTACHQDSGDFKNGYSAIMVAEEGIWKGGYLGYPRFGVCVDVRHGDLILKDPHQYHANTEIIGEGDYTRLSFVFYYRENMQKCTDTKENKRQE